MSQIPQTFVETPEYVGEGFWRDSLSQPSPLPFPQAHPHRQPGCDSFLKKLSLVEGSICLTEPSKGFSSICCLCDQDTADPNLDFVLVRSGEKDVRWPMGLKHYYEEHHIVPSKEFRAIIMTASLTGKSNGIRDKTPKGSVKAREQDRKQARFRKSN